MWVYTLLFTFFKGVLSKQIGRILFNYTNWEDNIGNSMTIKECVEAFHIWRENSVRQNKWLPEIGWHWAKDKGVKYKARFSLRLEDWKCSIIRVLNFSLIFIWHNPSK